MRVFSLGRSQLCWLRCVMMLGGGRLADATRGGRYVRGCGLLGGAHGKRRGANALLVPEPLMSLYRAALFPASSGAGPGGWPPELAGARMVAVRVADLGFPLRRPAADEDRTALTAAGT